MDTRKPYLMKWVIKYCSRMGICRDTEKQCKPIKCKYFKYIVLPSWRKDIKGRKGEYWEKSKEYGEYEKVIDCVY